jgi:hypothetical protein
VSASLGFDRTPDRGIFRDRRRCDTPPVLAGLMLIAGGVLMGVASRAPWAELPTDEGQIVSLTLDIKSAGALGALATFLVTVGVIRLIRGYREDAFVQNFGTLFVLVAAGIGVAAVALFLRDHGLAATALESYEQLRPKPGLYVAGSGGALALLSRLA